MALLSLPNFSRGDLVFHIGKRIVICRRALARLLQFVMTAAKTRKLPKTLGYGIYARGRVYWLAFTPRKGESQRHVSLKTDDDNEARRRAAEYRKNPELAGIGTWQEELRIYLFTKNMLGKHTLKTLESTRECIGKFFEFCNVKTPGEIKDTHVENYFVELGTNGLRAGVSRAVSYQTLVTYQARLMGFFNWLIEVNKRRDNPIEGNYFKKVKGIPPTRSPYLPEHIVRRLIRKCKNSELKFILFAGFHAGLRKDEIINATPEWFDFIGHTINVPAEQEIDERIFRPKGKKARSIPLSKPFYNFLTKSYRFQRGQKFALQPKGKGFGKRYRYDFRKPYDAYLKSHNQSLTIHGMRHSFASNCARADLSLTKVAAWLGDRVRTVEDHYFHLTPKKGELSKVFH